MPVSTTGAAHVFTCCHPLSHPANKGNAMRKLLFVSLIASTAFAASVPVKVRVSEWFTQRGVFTANIVLPEFQDSRPNTPDRMYAMRCDKGIDAGVYDAFYNKEKAKLEIRAVSLKGKSETIKCTLIDHQWLEP